MTWREIAEELQDAVQHNRIEYKELEDKCDTHNLDMYDDVLEPIGFNVCERCHALCDSEQELFWLDGFDWDEETDKTLLANLAKEQTDYCAICYDCVNELRKENN